MTVQGSQLRVAYKNPCRIASTANLGLTGLAAIDGVTPVAGDRVLAKDQTSQPARGIYVAASGAWARADDMDSSSNTDGDQITAGLAVYIQEGTANAKKTWVLTTTGTIVLDTTSLTFEEGPTVGGGGGGTTAVTQTQAVFVSKAGNDSDTGLTKDDPLLTLSAAITAANTLTPSVTNPVVIYIQDAGIYTGGISLPAFVSLIGPDAAVEHTSNVITMGNQCKIALHRVEMTSNDVTKNIVISGAAEVWIDCDLLLSNSTSASQALIYTTVSGAVVHLNVKRMELDNGVGIWSDNATSARFDGYIGELFVDGVGDGFYLEGTSVLDLTIERFTDSGTGFGVKAVVGGTPIANLRVGTFNVSDPWQVATGGTLNLFVNDLTGTGSIETGTVNVTEAGAPLLTQTNAVYVSKAGDNGDNGLSKDTPKLTIAAAVTVATGLTPTTSNRITIFVQDGGIYSGAVTLPGYVSLVGPAATFTSTVTTGVESLVHLHRIVGGSPIVCAAAGKVWIKADLVEATTGDGIETTNASAEVHLDVEKIQVITGVAIYGTNTNAGRFVGRVGEILITGAGYGLWGYAGAEFYLDIDRLIDTGTAVDGINLNASGVVANLRIGELNTAGNLYDVVSGATLSLLVGTLTGSGTGAGTINITEAGVGGGTTAVTQLNSVYVSKAGNDSNTGLTKDDPLLTIGAAITAASGLTPTTTNRVTIYIQDGGIYTEHSLTLPSYVSIIGLGATVGNTNLGDILIAGIESTIHLHRITSTNGPSAGVLVSAAGDCWIKVDEITIAGGDSTAIGIQVTNAGAVVYLDVGYIQHNSGAGLYISAAAEVKGFIKHIHVTGNGSAINVLAVAALLNLEIEQMTEVSGGTGVNLGNAATIANLTIGEMNISPNFNIGTLATVNAFVRDSTGTQVTGAGTLNITEAGIFPSAGLTQLNSVFVSKAGNDSFDGLSEERPKLTLGSAITAANTLTPATGNRVTINIQDAGSYSESITLPSYVSLYGPDARVIGGDTINMGIESHVTLGRISAGSSAVVFNAAGEGWLTADFIEVTGISGTQGCVAITNALAIAYINVKHMDAGVRSGVTLEAAGTVKGYIGSIEGSSEGIYAGAAGTADLSVGEITSGTGVSLALTGAVLTLMVRDFAPTTQFNVVAGATANVIASQASGATGVTTGTVNLLTAADGGGGVGGSTGATDNAVLLADGGGGATVKSSDLTVANIRDYNPVKRPCRVATTADVASTSAAAPLVVDGVTLVADDRVLVWRQDDIDADLENGIYTVTSPGAGATGVWARAADWDSGSADYLTAGNSVYIQEGDLWARTNFTLVTTGAITVATTATEFIPEGGLARSDASSTEIIASTAFTNGTFVVDDAGFTNMRDHSEVAIFFMPLTLGTNTIVDIVVFWSDDGTTVPFALDDNIQQSDFDIVNQADGSYNPKPYTARLTTVGSELVAGKGFHLVVPKGGGACKVGVKGNAADGTFTVRTQRLVN